MTNPVTEAVAQIIDPDAFSEEVARYEQSEPVTLWPERREWARQRANAAILAHLLAIREPGWKALAQGNTAGLATEVLCNDARFACEYATWQAMIDQLIASARGAGA